MDVELKVFGSEDLLTDTTGPEQLVAAVLDEITLIGGENRTIFSSFDETVAELVKTARPGYYSALLSSIQAWNSSKRRCAWSKTRSIRSSPSRPRRFKPRLMPAYRSTFGR